MRNRRDPQVEQNDATISPKYLNYQNTLAMILQCPENHPQHSRMVLHEKTPLIFTQTIFSSLNVKKNLAFDNFISVNVLVC